MDELIAIDALSALAQRTRIQAFRHLVASFPGEIPAGDIAGHCGVPHNTMSSHLAALGRAGLVKSLRDGRTVRYRADMDGLRALVSFLARDCCEGRPDLCVPLLAELAEPSCTPACGR